MAWIGFCTQCGTDVLLTEAGGCKNGHPYDAIRDIREDSATPLPTTPPAYGATAPVPEPIPQVAAAPVPVAVQPSAFDAPAPEPIPLDLSALDAEISEAQALGVLEAEPPAYAAPDLSQTLETLELDDGPVAADGPAVVTSADVPVPVAPAAAGEPPAAAAVAADEPAPVAPDAPVPVAPIVAPVPAGASAGAPARNRIATAVLVGLLNVVLLGGLVYAGSSALGWFQTATPAPAPAKATRPKPAATKPVPAQPGATPASTGSKTKSGQTTKPAAGSTSGANTASTTGANTSSAALDLTLVEGSWRNADGKAKLRGIVLDPQQPRVVVAGSAGEQSYPAEISIDSDGMLTIEAEVLEQVMTGRITALDADKMIVKSLGSFSRVADGTW